MSLSLSLDKSTWKRVRFGDLVRNVNDYFDADADGVLPYVAGPHINGREVTVAGYGSTDDDAFPPTFKRKFKSGDVLLHSRGIDKLAVVDREGVTGEKLFVLRTINAEELSQRYLPWLLLSPQGRVHMADHFTGSVNKFLNWGPLANFEFYLPPIEEQERLADLLWAVEAHRTALCESEIRSAMALECLLANWWVPEHMTPIASIGNCVTGSTPPKASQQFWDTEEVPFFTPTEIQGDTVAAPRQWVSELGAQRGRLLQANSVLVACIGGDMGKSSVLDRTGITNQQITAITGMTSDEAYLLQALLSHPLGRRATASRETTTIVRKLNKSDLMEVEIPWGDDRAEVAAKVDAVRRVKASVHQEFRALEGLRTSLLNEIFGDI